jgi:hypothetical protein
MTDKKIAVGGSASVQDTATLSADHSHDGGHRPHHSGDRHGQCPQRIGMVDCHSWATILVSQDDERKSIILKISELKRQKNETLRTDVM